MKTRNAIAAVLTVITLFAIYRRGAEMQKPSMVYFTRDISAGGLMRVYHALGRRATGRVAIKLHMGESGNKNFLDPELLREFVTETKGAFVDCTVYYKGPRDNATGYARVAREHGFGYAPIDILDADGEIALPIRDGRHLKEAIVGANYANYDFLVSVAHFKGHEMAGFGGTFKNLAIGLASGQTGKGAIHGDGRSMWGSTGATFFEKIAEYNRAVIDDRGDKILYINVISRLSVDCDCIENAHVPQMADIGIMASLDPVALDRASVDSVYDSPDPGKRHLIERIESLNGTYLLEVAETMGLGSQNYKLIDLDRL